MLSSLMQVSVQRNQERAMVWPHVSARPAFSAKGYEFTARNKGLGPALVNAPRRPTQEGDPDHVPAWFHGVAQAAFTALNPCFHGLKRSLGDPWNILKRLIFPMLQDVDRPPREG